MAETRTAGACAEAGADHRHVAGVVDDAFLLLEGGLVLLVDDDQAEVGERQEQRGAGADNHGRGAVGDGAPGGAAGARGQVGVPDGGGDAEAALEALQPLGGEGDFRQQHQRLAALAEAFGDGFQVDLGLAGAGDAVEQGDGEVARGDVLARRVAAADCWSGERVSPGWSGSGMAKGGATGRMRGDQQAGVGHASDHAGADAGGAGQVGGGAGFARRPGRPGPSGGPR